RHLGATPSDSDEGLIHRFHDPVRTDPALAAAYPAHLHIDLLPRLQGLGWGRALMRRMLERLALAGAGGVHLGVAESNTGAHVFYERIGFVEIERDDLSRTYARPLTT
ncbi:MAG: GNAT family N-acetyltransferase, partial [Ornithinibacter sp.]